MTGPLWLDAILSAVCAGLILNALKLLFEVHNKTEALEALLARREAARLARLRELAG